MQWFEIKPRARDERLSILYLASFVCNNTRTHHFPLPNRVVLSSTPSGDVSFPEDFLSSRTTDKISRSILHAQKWAMAAVDNFLSNGPC